MRIEFYGYMWPTAFALKERTAADETRIRELMKRTVGGVEPAED